MIDYGGDDAAHAIAIQADGRIVLAGTGYEDQFAVTRLNPDGSLDTSFGGDGAISIVFGGDYAAALGVALQADGRVVVAEFQSRGARRASPTSPSRA